MRRVNVLQQVGYVRSKGTQTRIVGTEGFSAGREGDLGENEVAAVLPHQRSGTRGTQGVRNMRKFRGTSASGQRPRGNSIATGHDLEWFLRGSFSEDAGSANGAERQIVPSFNTLVARQSE